jgi:hypothetical protein
MEEWMFLEDLKEIEEQYEVGTNPGPEDLSGKYKVSAPWYPWIPLEPIRHTHHIAVGGQGENQIFDKIKFGRFELENGFDSLIVNYDVPGNPPVFKGIFARVRRLPDGRFAGKLYIKALGKEFFLMFFELLGISDD